MNVRGPYRIGAAFFLLSGALHVFAFLVGGFSAEATRLIPIGIVYGLIAIGLFQGWRWLAYVAFLIALIGSIAALFSGMGMGTIPTWWWMAILLADVLAALGLFAALWRDRPAPAVS